MKATPAQRVLRRAQKTTDGCLVWRGYRDPRWGYGRLWVKKRAILAHRIIWEAVNGPIADGMCVLHRCDNPPCVNIDHLFLGTHAENMRDKVRKGRQPRGTQRPNAKLTEADVVAIRARRAAGETQSAVAASFGISGPTVCQIVKRRRWGHVP